MAHLRHTFALIRPTYSGSESWNEEGSCQQRAELLRLYLDRAQERVTANWPVARLDGAYHPFVHAIRDWVAECITTRPCWASDSAFACRRHDLDIACA
jgi:hypothetical protein